MERAVAVKATYLDINTFFTQILISETMQPVQQRQRDKRDETKKPQPPLK